MSDKEIRADAKLKNLPREMLETLWRYRHPEDDGQVMTYVDILAALQTEHGIASSLASLSEFYAWLGLKIRMENAQARAAQVRMELAKDSTITPDDLERIAQTVFTAEAIEGKDVKGYVALATLRLNRERTALDREKLTAATKGKIEAGLDALFAEIKGNAKAEAAFAKLQEVVNKS